MVFIYRNLIINGLLRYSRKISSALGIEAFVEALPAQNSSASGISPKKKIVITFMKLMGREATAESPTPPQGWGKEAGERPNKTSGLSRIWLAYGAVFLFFLSGLNTYAQEAHPLHTEDKAAQQRWVDSIYNAMSLQERIGQLFMMQVFSAKDKDTAYTNKIKRLIEDHHIGGLIFTKGGPVRQGKLINRYQEMSKTPLLIAMDAEWGAAMRLDSTFAYPWNMTLGAIKDDTIIEKIGARIGTHLKRMGVHVNFAPDVDINTNPKNPIIGNRSFGEDKENVSRKAIAFTRGMQNAGVMGCGKHFPGHGDTDKDSHKTLPTVAFSKERIDSIELYPYKQLIKEGLASVMIAHLNVPSLEPRAGYPSSISRNIVSGILKEEMGFKGLIFTDALGMKGASDFAGPGDIDLEAFLAGNDVLLMSGDIVKATQKIEEAYAQKTISEARLAHSVKKILMAKYKAELHRYKPVKTAGIMDDIITLEDKMLYEEAIKSAITVIKNNKDVLPVKNLEDKRIAYVSFGDDSGSHFLKALQKYAKVDHVKADMLNDMLVGLAEYNLVIVGLHRSDASPWKPYKFTSQELVWLYEIARIKKVIVDVFVKPYALLDLASTENIEGIVVSYQNSKTAQEKSAELIFGAIEAKGTLPVSAHKNFPLHMSLKVGDISRLQYGIPESVGVNSVKLKKVDSVVQIALDSAMVPGAQLLVARKGKVIYHKTYGNPTYDAKRPVKPNDIYDVASLTKILSSLPMVMKLEESGKISLKTKLREMLPELKETNKGDLTVLNIMSHYARLKPWIPFYIATLDTTRMPSEAYYSSKPSTKFGIKVTDNLYLRNDYKDSIFQRVADTDLRERLEYRYSDLPFFILKRYIEKAYNKPLDKLVQEHIYKPIGANYTTYNPLEKFNMEDIIPSEVDTYYRYQVIRGHVHDMGAAMQGGVGGHAGLFTTANDIAKIMQMYLQKGFYGGKRYFKESTINKFNKCHFCSNNNRRGVGFDKPQLGKVGPTCGCVSMTSFGHSGFTGTYTWADPEAELVYVFLSNRTYPTATNRKLITHGTRTIIQQLIYDAIED